MPHVFALGMTRPHEALGLPQPIGRRLPQGIVAWNLLFLVLTLVFGCMYIVQVNRATAKGYALRAVEKRVESLQTEQVLLQDKIANVSSLQSLTTKAAELGFHPAEGLEFVNIVGSSYALAR